MPTYEYECNNCGHMFEVFQSITAKPLRRMTTPCEGCGKNGAVKRLISGGAAILFKGSGFYLTDYARAGSKDPEKESAGGPSSESGQSGKKSRDRSESSDSTSKSSDGPKKTAASGSKNSD